MASSPTWLNGEYANMVTSIDTGLPLYYYPAFLKCYPHNPTLSDMSFYLGFSDFAPMAPDDQVYDGIIFLPPADQAYSVEIVGHFYTPQFTLDTQSTYWSVRAPEMLLMAALRMVEVFKRNSEGVKDWENAVKEQLVDLDKDSADESAVDAVEMEG
jgi:hypothetical protein